MKRTAGFIALLGLVLAGAACKKKRDQVSEASAAPAPSAPAAGAAEAPPEQTAQEAQDAARQQASEQQARQALLEYSTMEDRYLGDAGAQWASSARASSSFGDADKQPPESQAPNTPWQATGAPNGGTWSNNHVDMGIDWLELSYARPVAATELRAVMTDGVGSVSKVELIDEAGAAHEVWAGVDDSKPDPRGPRTWFVRTFPRTEYKVAKVKLSLANALVHGYKEVDAVQLVGE